MNDDIKGLRDDIAFMRALAEEGRSPPVLGGVTLLAAGTTFALASLAQWAVQTGIIAASPLAYSMIWAASLVVFVCILMALKPRLNAMPGARAPSNRAVSMAWSGVGWGIFAMFVSMAVICWRDHSTMVLMLAPSIVLTLYGVGWSVAAAVSQRRWIWWTAAGSFVGAVIMAYASDRPVVYLLYAVALVLLAAVPGLFLMRQEPSLTV
jgi:hypothetical protein